MITICECLNEFIYEYNNLQSVDVKFFYYGKISNYIDI